MAAPFPDGGRPRRSPARVRSASDVTSKGELLAAKSESLPAALKAHRRTSPGPLSDVKYFSKYLIFPMTWMIARSFGNTHMMPALLGGSALRYVVALVMTVLSKLDSVAEPVRVHRENPPVRQHDRELDWDGPVILSPIAFLLVDLLTPWLQASHVVPFSLQSLGWCALWDY